jgi:hypothetical protein
MEESDKKQVVVLETRYGKVRLAFWHLPTPTDTDQHLLTPTDRHLPTPTDTYQHLHRLTPTDTYRHRPTPTNTYRHRPTTTDTYSHWVVFRFTDVLELILRQQLILL